VDAASEAIVAGRYRLERKLGRGASAVVWRAYDTVLERHVALKILTGSLDDEPQGRERFRREALAIAQLQHPHIVTLLDSGEDDGAPFLVLEYVAGETLKERIRRVGRLPVGESIAYAIEVARGLAAAHERGIVHRDVKSQNILLSTEAGAKLTDFGISRRGNDIALTQRGRVLGTTDYVSPEQALGRQVGGQTDLYSLGIVLYEALAGAVPFRGPSQISVATMHVRDPLPDPQLARPEISAALAAVLERATAKTLPRRYQDAQAMIADLEKVFAIETARAGGASGEASSVLRTLPAATSRRLPLRVRHPGSTAASWGAAALVVIAAATLAFSGAHEGIIGAGSSSSNEQALNLMQAHATVYNPFGSGLDNASAAGLAIDRSAVTGWSTNRYDAGKLGKPGVGIYISLAHPEAANRLVLATNTPGFSADVWATDQRTVGSAATAATQTLAALGWTQLSTRRVVGARTRFPLVGARAWRDYLVWITVLEPAPPGTAVQAEITNIKLLALRGS
jgi:serine/threonine-protein kinase